jgi:hypothetical protein
METETHETNEKLEVATTETQAVVPSTPAEGEGEGEQLTTAVVVEPPSEKPTEETTDLVPAVLAVVVAIVGLIAVVKKLATK